MRKQELIHLHALCVLVRSELEERRDVPLDTFRAYDDLGVPPTAVYRRKDTHEEALFRLLDGLGVAIDTRSPGTGDSDRAPRSAAGGGSR